MDKKLDIAKAKELRGEIIEKLYDFYGEAVSLSTVRSLLQYKNYYSEKEIKKAVSYLAGQGTGYIRLEHSQENFWDSPVSLTPIGVNLAEGDKTDVGVLIDE